MARRSIATSVAAFWVVLSIVDLLQFADLSIHTRAYSARTSASSDLAHSARVVNNAVENRSPQIEGAEFSMIASLARRNGRFPFQHKESAAAREIDAPDTNRKIYKFCRTFLI